MTLSKTKTMTLDDVLKAITESMPQDWVVMPRPTFQHSFTFQEGQDGQGQEATADRYELGEAPVCLGFKKNLSITLVAGTIDQAKYVIPVQTPFSEQNARTVFVDCFFDSILIHRETLVAVDRQHCLLPLPEPWTEEKQKVAKGKVGFAQLIHELIGPFTDFETYMTETGLVPSDLPWPPVTKAKQLSDMSSPNEI